MSAISLKSITGITSITTPAGVDNQLTLHTNNTTERVRITSAGKVGINEVNPTEMLHIKAEDNTDSFGGIIVYANNNSVYTKHGWRGLDSNEAVRFAISGTEKMRLTNGGKLALGRTGADEMIHITAEDNTDVFGGIKVAPNNNSVHVKYGWRGIDGSDQLRFGVAGNEKVRITSGGGVYIGNTGNSFNSVLGVHKAASNSQSFIVITNNSTGTTLNDGFVVGLNGSQEALLFNKESTPMRFATAGSERLRITAAGHIVTQGLTSYTFNNDGANQKIFEVTGDGTVGEYGVINISGNINSSATVGAIRFNNRENTATSSGSSANSTNIASIDVFADTSDSNAGDDCGGFMRFITKADGGGNAERLRITSVGQVRIPISGKLTVGHTNPSARFTVGPANGSTNIEIEEYGVIRGYNRNSSAWSKIDFEAGYYVFDTDGTEKFRIKSDGNVVPGTNNATSIGDGTKNFNSIWASTRFRGNDNVKLVLGNSQDLVVYHDGSGTNYINSPQGGSLHIKSGTGDNANLKHIQCDYNGNTIIYHQNSGSESERIRTTNDGITFGGEVNFSSGYNVRTFAGTVTLADGQHADIVQNNSGYTWGFFEFYCISYHGSIGRARWIGNMSRYSNNENYPTINNSMGYTSLERVATGSPSGQVNMIRIQRTGSYGSVGYNYYVRCYSANSTANWGGAGYATKKYDGN